MQIISYGEDALTLWALKNKLENILFQLNDPSKESDCLIFYRPSFGRSGGKFSSQFGEFDFIILSKYKVYLGESKWFKSSEIKNGLIHLRKEQLLRHKIFECYIKCWLESKNSSWNYLRNNLNRYMAKIGIEKPIPPSNSILAFNLITILTMIKDHFRIYPKIRNVLLYLYSTKSDLPDLHYNNFEFVSVDFSEGKIDNLIRIDLG